MMDVEQDIWEAAMRAQAVRRHEKKRVKALESRRESTSEPHHGMVKAMVARAAGVVEKTCRKRGRPAVGVRLLKAAKTNARVAAMIGARTVTDGITMGHRVQALAVRIGGRIEDEHLVRKFAREEPRLYEWIKDSLKERGSQDYRHRRKVVLGAMRRSNAEVEGLGWSEKEKADVGLLVLNALVEGGLVEKRTIGVGKGKRPFLVLTPEAEQGLRDRNDAIVNMLCSPWFKPIMRPPLPWASPTSGGYHTYEADLVKSRKRQYVERLRSADMPDVYATINALQETAWRINEDVLVVLEELWDQGHARAGLPAAEDPPAPPRPASLPPYPQKPETDEAKADLKTWREATRMWHNGVNQRKSKVTQARQLLSVAAELRRADRFYFPHQLDYRGRAYAMPLVLNPQSDDLSRGLLTFATAKPLGEMGGFWLAVHGANSYGNDKVSLAARADWVLDHEAAIQAVAADPLEAKRPVKLPSGALVTPLDWWADAENPWQFLAFCLEWAAYLDSGESPDFESSLPVSIDGSCNGLQHYSAMLRDAAGAEAVNLTKAKLPQDLYQRVADRVRELLVEAAAGADGEKAQYAREWLAYGTKGGRFERKLVKRQVMTTPYGVTVPGMLDQLVEELKKRAQAGPLPFEKWGAAARFITPLIHRAIAGEVAAASEAMEFLRAMARVATDAGAPLFWTSPSGFPVMQEILATRHLTVRTKLMGEMKLNLVQDTKRLDRRKQSTSVAPNFVHSYDAAHLCRTVTRMEAGGRRAWAVVHDSFGTHAGDVEELAGALRSTFVELYEDRAPLADFREQVAAALPPGTELPELPPVGSFDLRQVLEAEFFFA